MSNDLPCPSTKATLFYPGSSSFFFLQPEPVIILDQSSLELYHRAN